MDLSSEIKTQISFFNKKMLEYSAQKKRIFVSSSFQTHSIPLLHILSKIDQSVPVFFLNTGFHFSETLTFRDMIAKLLNLNLHSIESSVPKSLQKNGMGKFLFCSNPDYCCHLNKIAPLEPILMSNDIWISGVRRDQNQNRKQMSMEAKGPYNTTRFHPMLEWNSKMIYEYRKFYSLPEHPLEKEGYLSVGCKPCTHKYTEGQRDGRWAGLNKNECGLHTDLINK